MTIRKQTETADGAPDRPTRELICNDGTRAVLRDAAGPTQLEILDGDGSLLFRYDPASGDMTLNLPRGNLMMQVPNGDVGIRAGGTLTLEGDTVQVSARMLGGTAEEAALEVGRVSTRIGRLVQIIGTAYARIRGLNQILAGRQRTVVRGDTSLRAEQVSIQARKDVRANGEHIRLG